MATAAPSLSCDPCKGCGEEQVPVAFCLDCRELYCKTCLNRHVKTTATKLHAYIYLAGDESGKKCSCDLCDADNDIAKWLCGDCRQLYCTACTNRHRMFKATKDHVIVQIICDRSTTISSELNSKADTASRSDVKQEFHCKFSVRASSDKESANIAQLISLPDGRICAVDRGNNKIKLYTDDYVLCDEVCVPKCTAVTCVDGDTVAVATGSEITSYSVKGNTIRQKGTALHNDGDIYDIAYRRGEFITRYSKHNTDYTCCGSKAIVKQDRRLLLFDFIHYDLVSDCVILGNFMEATIVCYTVDGGVKWSVKTDGAPTGMVVVHGVVLVADYNNNTIHQIMDGCLLSTPLMTKNLGITRPREITYQHKQHRLLIAQLYNKNVMVFNVTRKRKQ